MSFPSAVVCWKVVQLCDVMPAGSDVVVSRGAHALSEGERCSGGVAGEAFRSERLDEVSSDNICRSNDERRADEAAHAEVNCNINNNNNISKTERNSKNGHRLLTLTHLNGFSSKLNGVSVTKSNELLCNGSSHKNGYVQQKYIDIEDHHLDDSRDANIIVTATQTDSEKSQNVANGRVPSFERSIESPQEVATEESARDVKQCLETPSRWQRLRQMLHEILQLDSTPDDDVTSLRRPEELSDSFVHVNSWSDHSERRTCSQTEVIRFSPRR